MERVPGEQFVSRQVQWRLDHVHAVVTVPVLWLLRTQMGRALVKRAWPFRAAAAVVASELLLWLLDLLRVSVVLLARSSSPATGYLQVYFL